MTTCTTSIATAERQLSDPALARLVQDIGVPPQPAVIAALQAELGRDEPDLRRVATAVASDAAFTAAVLRTANSPAYGLTRRAETLGQALALLGLRQVGVIVSSIVLRNLIPTDGPRLTRFWDVSAKRAWALARLARGLRGVDVDIAQTFGLFCDVGIPLLMRRFPDYGPTLQAANASVDEAFTAVEHRAHGAIGIGLVVPQRDQCAHRVIGHWCRRRTGGRWPTAHAVDLVGQVENDLLGLLAPHARHTHERGDVLLAKGAHHTLRRECRQNAQ
jgi:HD-like signal output (HDOD) protein